MNGTLSGCCPSTGADLQASYCTVSLFLSLHITSVNFSQQHTFLSLLPSLFYSLQLQASFFSSRDLGVCTQFLLCKSFSWMDEQPWPIHQHAYPPPSPLFLYHLAVNLTSDVPVSRFFYPSSLSLFFAVSTSLSSFSPFLGHTATMGNLPSTPAVKRL